MNTNSKFVGLMLVVVGWMLVGQSARSAVVYNDTSNRASTTLFDQSTGYQMGDEIILNAGAVITNFVFEYFGTGFSGDEQARLRFYANDGAVYGTNDYGPELGMTNYAPGTTLYDSGLFNIGNTLAGSATLAFNGTMLGVSKSVLVPSNFTWTVEFFNVTGVEEAGLTLFNQPTVGFNYSDYWEKAGGAWVLNKTNGTTPPHLNFGAFIEAKVDIIKPSCAISSPADKVRILGSTTNVNGIAADSGSTVVLVLYRVGHTLYGTNDFAPASFTAPNWSVTGVPLQAGTNFFQAKAVDGSGNESLLATRKFIHVVSNALTLVIDSTGSSGKVQFYPGTNAVVSGVELEVNRDYTVIATPGTPATGTNSVFTNWLYSVGGPNVVATSNPKYTFMMTTGLVITADFETNRFIGAAGGYFGLFADEISPMVSVERAGFFTFVPTRKQAFSGKIFLDGNSLGYAGTLNLEGAGLSKPILRKGKAALRVAVQMTFDGSDSVSGTVFTTSNAPSPYVLYPDPFVSALTGFKAAYNYTNNPATNLVGTYTLGVDAPTAPECPKGNGTAVITVKSNGSVIVGSMNLGDYASLKPPFAAYLSKDGDWPLFAYTYKALMPYTVGIVSKTNKEFGGMIWGWMKFTNNTGQNIIPGPNSGRELLDGYMDWIKYPNTNNFYPDGFTNHDLYVHGSAYLIPTNTKSIRVLNITDGNISLDGGNLPLFPFMSNHFFMKTNSMIIFQTPNINTQTCTIAYPSGKVTGKFTHPHDTGHPAHFLTGAILQDENIAVGAFFGTNASGKFLLKSD